MLTAVDAFDTWCLRKILRIPYTTLQMTQSGASRAAWQPLKKSSRSGWGFSGTWLDQFQRRTTTVSSPPDWRRPAGRRPRSTWLRVIDEDVRPQNFGVHTAWRKAKERDTWHQVRQRSARSLPPRRRSRSHRSAHSGVVSNHQRLTASPSVYMDTLSINWSLHGIVCS